MKLTNKWISALDANGEMHCSSILPGMRFRSKQPIGEWFLIVEEAPDFLMNAKHNRWFARPWLEETYPIVMGFDLAMTNNFWEWEKPA